MIPVILAGGAGTRLWPLSRECYPKQFLPLCSANTMLQETLLRLGGLRELRSPLIVCNEEHRFIIAEQLRQIGFEHSTLLLEPVGRNTAPAICAAALTALATGDDDLLLVLPADHVVHNTRALLDAIEVARNVAHDGALVTFGIRPTVAETSYGYIKARMTPGQSALVLDHFVEKPDLATA